MTTRPIRVQLSSELSEGEREAIMTRVEEVATAYGSWPDDVRSIPSLSEPEMFEFVCGESKGRPIHFGVDTDGRSFT
jgi:hypothetical protein